MKVQRVVDDQDSSFVTDATHRIDAQATADRVSQTPTLFIGKTGSKLKPVSSTATFDAAELAAAIRALG
jgi:GTPase Era involved in 16S rRNA processing